MPPQDSQNLCGVSRFESLWRRCQVEGAPGDGARFHRDLVAKYGEPARFYHTLEHIEQCLEMFESCKSLLDDPDSLELAIWFHDAVYNPGNNDNEEQSAHLYRRLSERAHRQPIRERVEHLIMATVHNGDSLDDEDTRYMVDIDLSSFGLPWEDFLRDSQNLRREASHLDDEEFYRGALGFHRGLLARERIYRTDFFAGKLERQARDNIQRYQEKISSTGC